MFGNILPQFSVNGYFVLYCHWQTLAKRRSVSRLYYEKHRKTSLLAPPTVQTRHMKTVKQLVWTWHVRTHTHIRMHKYTSMIVSVYLGSFDNQLGEAGSSDQLFYKLCGKTKLGQLHFRLLQLNKK